MRDGVERAMGSAFASAESQRTLDRIAEEPLICTRAILPIVRLYLQREVDRMGWNGVQTEVEIGERLGSIVTANVRFALLGSAPVIVSSYSPASWPADWWQAVKARWFPQWALRRWPVRLAYNERRDVQVHHRLCPHIPGYDAQQHVEFLLGRPPGTVAPAAPQE